MSKHSVFFPLTKVDVENRLVYGQATAEVPDRAREILDYETSKPYFKAWSADIEKASGGKSLGNVRAMHGKVAAGKLTDINFDDGAKAVNVCAKIVDDAEWGKVLEGVYTGFSIGGSYAKTWQDPEKPELRRYTAGPLSEISIVDVPCVPTATFDLNKADGTVEKVSFKPWAPDADAVFARAVELNKAAPSTPIVTLMAQARDELVEARLAKGDVGEGEDGQTGSGEYDGGDQKGDNQHTTGGKAPHPQGNTKDGEDGEGDKQHLDGGKDGDEGNNPPHESRHGEPVKGSQAENEPPPNRHGKVAENAYGDGEYIALTKREFSDKERQAAAHAGTAMPDGSFPIQNESDLHNAIQAVGRAKDYGKAKAHIISRAKAMGLTSALPDDWKSSSKMAKDGGEAKGGSQADADEDTPHSHASDEQKEASEEPAEAEAAAEHKTSPKTEASGHGGPSKADWGVDQVFQVRADGKVFGKKAEALKHVEALKSLSTDADSPIAKALADAMAKAKGEKPKTDERSPLIKAADNPLALKLLVDMDRTRVAKGWQLYPQVMPAIEAVGAWAYADDAGELAATVRREIAEKVIDQAAMLLDEDGAIPLTNLFNGLTEYAEGVAKALKAEPAELEKIGKRNSAHDQATIQAMHDHAMALGAMCKAENCAKEAAAETGDLAKVAAERDELAKQMADALPKIEELGKLFEAQSAELKAAREAIAKLEAEPMPMPTLRVVSKDAAPMEVEEAFAKLLEDMGPEAVQRLAMKAALSKPHAIGAPQG